MSNRIYQILVYLQVDICQRYTLRLSIYINFISQNFILHTSQIYTGINVHYLE